jgi:hypothetical protein
MDLLIMFKSNQMTFKNYLLFDIKKGDSFILLEEPTHEILEEIIHIFKNKNFNIMFYGSPLTILIH